MAVKVGINGFGRIGRNIFRAALKLNADMEFVAVNDIGDAKTFAHLLKHDTTFGTLPQSVSASADAIQVDGHALKFLSMKDPGELPWKDLQGRRLLLSELLGDATYERDGGELAGAGLFVALDGWCWHLVSLQETAPATAGQSGVASRPHLRGHQLR